MGGGGGSVGGGGVQVGRFGVVRGGRGGGTQAPLTSPYPYMRTCAYMPISAPVGLTLSPPFALAIEQWKVQQ